jgi:glutaredoxin
MTTIRLPLARPLALVAAALSLSSLTLPAHAVYKIVGPDGKVTYSDTPPPTGGPAKVQAVAVSSGGGAPNLNGLPAELRQAATKYPVTLYASAACRPCDTARQLLQQRGIPFAERTVGETPTDTTALQRLTGSTTLPVLAIGQQQLKGVTPSEWNSYLDAAGYPSQSKLPPSYRAPSPTALVPPAPTAPPAEATAPTATDAPAGQASGPNIRF